VGFPLVAKPRTGSGSRGVFHITGKADLSLARDLDGYMLQEVVGTEASEYTAGCFSDREGKVRGCLVIKRELTAGTTTRIEVGDFPDVRAEAERIVSELGPTGPCNVQVRVGPQGPVCFEINARYSGTAPIRAHFGFNDVEAGIRHFVLGEAAVDLPKVTQGWAARYWNEVYIEPEAIDILEQGGPLEGPATRARFAEELTGPPW
jgi:carbamoyl-phosphate synthase large subunit